MNKEAIRGGLTALAGVLPLKRRVLLESNPDLACNAWPVFQEMLADPAFADVELVWLVKDSSLWREKFPQPNVRFVELDPNDRRSKLRAILLALTSQCVVFCNKVLWPPRRGQLALFLGHGTPIKQCRGIYTPGRFCNRWVYPSEAVKDTMAEQFGLDPAQGLLLGYPRNDALTRPSGALDRLVDRQGRKCIFWLPTFRRHADGGNCSYALGGCGLPLLEEEGALERLNEALERAGVLLVLKPHPVQDMSAITADSCSAFRLISDEDLRRAGVQLYEALADADALLTDYSSVYCDYLLTGKPVGLTFDDLGRYEENRGFVADDIRTLVKGRVLERPEELLTFVDEVARGEDAAAARRSAANDYYNDLRDGASARRVTEYIRTFLNKGAL